MTRQLVAASLLLVACSSSPAPPADGSLDAPRPCLPGQRQCEGATLRECQGGRYVDRQTCAPREVCVASLGCVACEPGKATCVDNDVFECKADGTVGNKLRSCVTETCAGGKCISECDPATRLIYLVDNRDRLLSFNPDGGKNELQIIATLSCAAGDPWPGSRFPAPAHPYSMSVDRQGRAWVLYNSGQIFWVDVKTGSCAPSGFPPGKDGFKLFGMGFVLATGAKERLYVAGGDLVHVNARLGYLEPTDLALTVVGDIPPGEEGPELTGTSAGRLFAYFPGAQKSFVAELDPATAQHTRSWSLPPLAAQVTAWAFAHWGGKFYIFVTTTPRPGEDSAAVLRLDPQSGQTETVMSQLPHRVVGAGVSTCAPTVD